MVYEPTGVWQGRLAPVSRVNPLQVRRFAQALGQKAKTDAVDTRTLAAMGQVLDRPGLDQAMAAVRKGDTLVVPKLDRLARSVPDARHIADQLQAKGVKLALGRNIHDPNDPMGKMFFNILATFAEFEADLIRMRTHEGMAIARAKGKLRGKQPKLSEKQQKELCRMHFTGDYSIGDLAEVFAISRPTVYRTLSRVKSGPHRNSDIPNGHQPHNLLLVVVGCFFGGSRYPISVPESDSSRIGKSL